MTYFILILAQLRVVQQAVKKLYVYLDKKMRGIRATERILQASVVVNRRQLGLLGHALNNLGERHTIAKHQASQRVTYYTARDDLLDLAARNVLVMSKAGCALVFTAPRNLSERLRDLS